jgi:inorganic triphosphatase YgiF
MIKEQVSKFEVDTDWVMPPVAGLVPDGGRVEQEVRKLDNSYFDTPGAGLRLFGITLRRRVGGSETGWQLKVPSGTARTELQSGSRAKSMPPALAKGVEGLRAGESLDPVATIVTTRTAYQLLNADDELVLEIADDQVESGPPDGVSMLHSWREVEVELGPAGKKKDLKRATKMLLAAGAAPGTTRTKLDRALGPTLPDGQPSNIEHGTVGDWSPRTSRSNARCWPAMTSGCVPARQRRTRHEWRRAAYAAPCGSLATCSSPGQLRS